MVIVDVLLYGVRYTRTYMYCNSGVCTQCATCRTTQLLAKGAKPEAILVQKVF